MSVAALEADTKKQMRLTKTKMKRRKKKKNLTKTHSASIVESIFVPFITSSSLNRIVRLHRSFSLSLSIFTAKTYDIISDKHDNVSVSEEEEKLWIFNHFAIHTIIFFLFFVSSPRSLSVCLTRFHFYFHHSQLIDGRQPKSYDDRRRLIRMHKNKFVCSLC